jgi:hypothetical protein
MCAAQIMGHSCLRWVNMRNTRTEYFTSDVPSITDITRTVPERPSRANTGSRKSSGVTCVSLHAPAHNRTGGFPAYGSGFAYLGDDAVGFFDATTAVHENLGACRSQRKRAGMPHTARSACDEGGFFLRAWS